MTNSESIDMSFEIGPWTMNRTVSYKSFKSLTGLLSLDHGPCTGQKGQQVSKNDDMSFEHGPWTMDIAETLFFQIVDLSFSMDHVKNNESKQYIIYDMSFE